ncbi:hypothetical protein ABE61_15530, partial [Lysinibacillus sphaericus]|nr:hypothetical protein [Lysinibacillus sphaericus]
ITEKLLKKSGVACGARVHEVLLSGIAKAIGRMTSQQEVAIKLEGHGRERLHEPIEIDRTIGWFTNVYPVIFDCIEDTRRSVIGAKEAVRSVPNGGLGYGILQQLGETCEVDISFNYLGDFNGVGAELGYESGEENWTDDKLLLIGQAINGKIQFSIISQEERFNQAFIDEFSEQFKQAIIEAIAYCVEGNEEKTASDYEIYDISVSEFETLKEELAGMVGKIYELTPLQEGMLFHHLEDAASTGYVLQSIYKIGMEMNGDSIKEALHLLSIRYEVLRTAFIYRNVLEPKQVIYQVREPEYKLEDLTELSDEEKELRYEALVRQDVERGFDLQDDRLLRITYVKYGDNDVRLIWSMHHIIVDGWCLGILMAEFMKYYAKIEEGIQLSELEEAVMEEKKEQGEYSDYVHWLRKQDQEKAKEYWSELLDDYDSNCEITPMNKPEESSEEQMRRQKIAVNQKVASTLQRFAEQNGSTINTVAEVICGIMLQECTGNQDVVFGKVVSGRNADIKGIEDIVGLFINTIPVRVRTEDKMSIKDLLKKQQEQGNESTSYDYYSLAEIQNETLQGTELIKVLYVFENYMSGLELEQQETDTEQMMVALERVREQTNYPISITGYEMDETLCFDIMYNPNQFSDEEIQRLLERLEKISEEIAENPDRRVAEIETVTEDEKEKILHDFNATKTEYP